GGGSWSTLTSSSTPLTLLLNNFSMEGKNTIAIAFQANLKNIGWAFNLSSQHDEEMSDVFLHFNPRYLGTKPTPEGSRPRVHMLHMTDRQGTWGEGERIRLAPNHPLLEGEGTLVINIRPEGFIMHLNQDFIAFFPHRRDISQETAFKLQFLVEDDNGNAYDVIINSVWWGHEHLTSQSLSTSVRIHMEEAYAKLPSILENPAPPRTLIATGLPVLDDLLGLQSMEYALMDAFGEHGVETVRMVRGKGKAYVRVSIMHIYITIATLDFISVRRMGTCYKACLLLVLQCL
ncbi:hypothetical protein EON65_54200, partial [archaeon]